MGLTYTHEVMIVPPTLEEVIELLQKKYAAGWVLNTLHLVKITDDQPQQPAS